jgi:protein O-mannosyl-transferase
MSRGKETKTFYNDRVLMISLLLAITVAAVYWQAGRHGFINLDDRLYVSDNQHVRSGLTAENISWAFTSFRASNWHPLTWISHMTDCEIFGMNPGIHHLVNVFFHIANALLLFLVLYEMAGSLWRSAFVAFLFALHPLHVESVAWIAERKDVLSTFFWMLALLCYCRYVRYSGLWRYVTVLVVFLMGLMAKPMIVTLPFVFLLLDYWPLGRIQIYGQGAGSRKAPGKKQISYVLLEKIPFLVLAAASSIITVIAQKSGGAITSMESLPMSERLANAVVSYAAYLYKTAWPVNLAFFYPHPQTIPLLNMAIAVGALVSITIVAAIYFSKFPYLLVGWLWYLGTLVPVIGIVQVGSQAMADRYTYIPLIGIFIMISWGVADLVQSLRLKKDLTAAAACGLLLVLMVLTSRQAGFWRDDITLSMHAIEATQGNYLAHNNLGLALESEGRAAEAVDQYKKAVEADPRYLDAYVNLGVALSSIGRTNEAIGSYMKAIQLRPDSVEARVNLGGLLLKTGRIDQAISQFKDVLAAVPASPEAHNALGVALARKGDLEGALGQFREAVRIDPGNEGARMNLQRLESMKAVSGNMVGGPKDEIATNPGNAEEHVKSGDRYRGMGKRSEAIGQYLEALRIDNGYVPALSRLAVVYGEAGEDGKSLGVLKELVKRDPGNWEVYYNIACLYSRHGQVDESVKWLKVAVARGFRNFKLMEKDKDLNNIRGSAYYKQLMGEVR